MSGVKEQSERVSINKSQNCDSNQQARQRILASKDNSPQELSEKARVKAILALAAQLEAQSTVTTPEESISEFKAAWGEVAHHA